MTTFGDDLIVGGNFTTAGGSLHRSIASWNGSFWSSIGEPLVGDSTSIHALGSNEHGLFMGGYIVDQTYGLRYVARWDGVTWQSDEGGTHEFVRAFEFYGGEAIVGGSF